MLLVGLDLDFCYRVMQVKDVCFDGCFFVCVLIIGIYCCLVCLV
jgi:Adenosine deaminase